MTATIGEAKSLVLTLMTMLETGKSLNSCSLTSLDLQNPGSTP
jgi:hypothetical protein